MGERKQRTSSGTWVVLTLIALGLVAAVVGLKFRKMPPARGPATAPSTLPSTHRSTPLPG